MKNWPAIFITVLTVLCICSCILLVIVILQTGDIARNIGTPLRNSFSGIMGRTGSQTAIRVPDRFKPIDEVPISDSSTALPTGTPPLPLPLPEYKTTSKCHDTLDSDDMILLLRGKDLFCKKSQWSKPWNNPRGKGIHTGKEGLQFQDSVVVDSFTNIMWQRYSSSPALPYEKMDAAISHLNAAKWQGFDNWRPPTIEEIMVLLVPEKNRYGLYLPGAWNCNVKDIWSCNPACDSLSTQWIWVARLSLGRCNYGHPDIERAVLAVRKI